MSLRTQIELMTVPQEFTRLCNAVLIVEHGDDFLPIDDDRADRGNDGYLKSEQRMFAAHCFKRVQNQAIDKLIRAKMIGDLGKAVALKRANVWPIGAWTFLSNYPISEHVAAEVSRIGRDAQIDVSWKGPDYFAAALTRHPEIAAEFPGLQVNKLSEQLGRIEQSLSGAAQVGADVEAPYPEPPRTSEEQEALLRRLPPAWEYLLFAGVLQQRRDALEGKWRDQELHLPGRLRRELAKDEIAPYLSRAFGRLGSIVEPMTRVFDAQQSAFGPPGEPGDAIRIEHFANWIMNAYEDMLDWGQELRSLDTPAEMEHAVELAARVVDLPLDQLRAFVDEVLVSTQALPAHLAKSKVEQEASPLVIEPTLTVSIDSQLTDEALNALRLALGLQDDFDPD